MPHYWILSMSEDNYLIAKEHGLIGGTEHGKDVIYRMTIGDIVTFYISRKQINASRTQLAQRVQKVRGVARVAGEAFISDESIWYAREGEIFPYRRPVEFVSDTAVDAHSLLKGLSYVTDPRYWALPFRKGYVEITEHDFDKIQAAFQTSYIP